LDNKPGKVEGPDIVGTLIFIMISIVVGVAIMPIMMDSIKIAKGEKITNTTALAPTPQTNPQNFLTLPNVGDPNVQLVFLVTLLGAVLLLVFYSIMRARKKENYSES
jgi:hypothetical protein